MLLAPIFRDLVLVGGGHAHALLIRMWAMNPLPGVRVTLISPSVYTPYSGMLPGLLAGHYQFEETQIDLARLCTWAGVRFIQSQAEAIDTQQQRVQIPGRPAIGYDALSIDTGSTPTLGIPGAEQYALPVKPVEPFYRYWQQLQQSTESETTLIIGGGAGSVELALAMAHRARTENKAHHLHLCTRQAEILPGYPKRLIGQVRRALEQANITLHRSFDVTRIDAKQVSSAEGAALDYDTLIACTQAQGAAWIASSGIDCTDRGFIKVSGTLQSLSHPEIFAAGDIAELIDTPCPKAGVYAVRQGRYLFDNLRHYLLGEPLKTYRPQHDFLSLLALGGQTAVGSKHGLSVQGRWVWRLKDRIDRAFMARFSDLPKLDMQQTHSPRPELIATEDRQDLHQPAIRCAGCGAKVGALLLAEVLEEISGKPFSAEDAAEIQLPDSRIFQSTDFLKTPLDDPYLFGRIATVHALSDLFARGAIPHSVQMTLVLPYAGRRVQKRELRQLLTAVQDTLNEHDCLLTGGHSAEGSELALGFSVIGTAGPALKEKTGLQPGQHLLLSKPLGTGVLLAAAMQQKANGVDVAHCLESMAKSNAPTAEELAADSSLACTDITGFGFLGHLGEMLGDAPISVELELDQIPLLEGALDVSQRGIKSSLYPHNLELAVGRLQMSQTLLNHPVFELLLDPQTSGGLLAGVSAATAERLVKNHPDRFWQVGRVCAQDQGHLQRQ